MTNSADPDEMPQKRAFNQVPPVWHILLAVFITPLNRLKKKKKKKKKKKQESSDTHDFISRGGNSYQNWYVFLKMGKSLLPVGASASFKGDQFSDIFYNI